MEKKKRGQKCTLTSRHHYISPVHIVHPDGAAENVCAYSNCSHMLCWI